MRIRDFSGIWLATLHAGKDLRLQLHLDLAATPAGGSIDSLDQGAEGIPCRDVVATDTSVALSVPSVVDLGKHIVQRLTGKPALTLAPAPPWRSSGSRSAGHRVRSHPERRRDPSLRPASK
jgi:hypothetical protein